MEALRFIPFSLSGAIAFYLMSWSFGFFQKTEKFSPFLFGAGFLFVNYIIYSRWPGPNGLPFHTLHESLILFSWCVAAACLVFRVVYKVEFITRAGAPLAALILVYACFQLDIEIQSPAPSLRSVWFFPHVVSYFIAYGILALSAFSSGFYLFINSSKQDFKSKVLLFSRTSMPSGFAFLTLGLATGAMWAKESWGDYWSWDPKETWALITWLAYLMPIHLKHRKKKFIWLNLLAFAIVLFTYLGTRLLPEGGLHIKGQRSYSTRLTKSRQ